MKSRKKTAIAISIIPMLFALLVLYRWGTAKPEIDANAIAKAETEMWKAYYAGDKSRLALKLMEMETLQFGIGRLRAANITNHLVHATLTFFQIRANYDQAVLPELRLAYQGIKAATNGKFDVEKAARAELTWWVARRDPQHSSPEEVGSEIAKLYGELYGGMRPEFQQAGFLRAQAATLRDKGGSSADWPQIENILRKSYGLLVDGMPSR